MTEELFVIVHAPSVMGDAAVFWRPNRSGYTWSLDQAGRYTQAEAEGIRGLRHGDDWPVPLAVAEGLAHRAVDRDQALKAAGFFDRAPCACATCERLREQERERAEQPPRAESTCQQCCWWDEDADRCDLGHTAETCDGRYYQWAD